jgi:transposase-like protein
VMSPLPCAGSLGHLFQKRALKMAQPILFLVQRFTVVENSDFSPTRLTAWETLLIIAYRKELSLLPISNSEDHDGLSCVCVPARLLPHPLSGAAVASLLVPSSAFLLLRRGKRSRLHRLRHRPAQTIVPPVVSPPHPRRLEGQRLRMSRAWREVTSRRGAPKRMNTEGFACPNPQCLYCGISDAHVHALVGDGEHGLLERIQTFGCQACRTTFTARRPTPLSRLKTPSRAGSQWCSQRWRKGWILRRLGVCSAFDKPPSPAFLTRAGSHAQTLHERFFCHLQLPHLQ